MNGKSIRVRFAPSPTGPLHLGGIRTALYNYLFAKQHEGTFILRIEDTDQNRFVPGAEEYILEALHWCGLEPDEDVVRGGANSPYRQSERSAIYREYIQILIDRQHAYYAFDTPEELESIRDKHQQDRGEVFQYNIHTRKQLSNSLTLSSEEVRHRIDNGEPYVVRIHIPENQEVIFQDLIRGEVTVHTANLDDKVLFKSDGLPTYHLANVVDDYLMKISHVIRGEEWLPSAPMHLLLYRFFGWEQQIPQFAHLPLILKPDGHGKLSKRDGDRLGFPVFPLEWKDPVSGEVFTGFRESGYLPAAFINMLALLGWNPGTEQEIFSLEELIRLFSLERIHKSGSRFDPDKAKWFNHQYLMSLSDETLAEMLVQLAVDSWQSSPSPCHPLDDLSYACLVVPLIRERITLFPDLPVNARLFYFPPESYDPQVRENVCKPGTPALIHRFMTEIAGLDPWAAEAIHEFVQSFTARNEVKTGALMMPLRLLLVGSNQGPGLTDIAAVIGKEDFLSRLGSGLERLG